MSRTVLTSYYRPKPGGFCRRYFRAIQALCERGHTVHALSVVRFPIEHENFRWHRFPWPSRWTDNYLFWGIFHLLAPWMLLATAVRHRVDRLFAFSPTYGLMLQLARRWLTLPLTVFIRADSLENHRLLNRPRWLIRLERYLERAGLAGARIECVSNALAASLEARHALARRPGVFPNDIPDLEPRHATGNNSALTFTMVGVLEPRKGQSVVLHALSTLVDGAWQLKIFGDGPDRMRLEREVVALNLSDHVAFHGWVSREALWKEVDVLLFPSRHEGAPNAVLEALSLSIPVLASDIPEIREVLPPDSLLPVDDVLAWRTRIQDILKDRNSLATLDAQQSEFSARLRFDWDANVAALITGDAT